MDGNLESRVNQRFLYKNGTVAWTVPSISAQVSGLFLDHVIIVLKIMFQLVNIDTTETRLL